MKIVDKKDLMEVGFNQNVAKDIIRMVKQQLAKEGFGLYNNPRIGFVPSDRVVEFLIGVPNDFKDTQFITIFLKNELVHLNDLEGIGIPTETAKQLIRDHQQTMADDGYIFYQNIRHWYVPKRLIFESLGGRN